MHDEQAKHTGPVNASSAATRHRLDSGSAVRPDVGRPMMEDPRNSIDGPRADSMRARDEMGKAAFGDDVRPVENLSFADAFKLLMGGEKVARAGWNGRGQFVALAIGSRVWGRALGSDVVASAHLVLRNTAGDLVAWLPSTGDLFGLDWCLVREVSVLQYGHGDATGSSGAER